MSASPAARAQDDDPVRVAPGPARKGPPASRPRRGEPEAPPLRRSTPPRLAWELDAGRLGGKPVALAASPLAGAAVVALSDGTVAGLEPTSGDRLWAFTSEIEVSLLRIAGDRLLVAGSARDAASASASRLLLCTPPGGERVWLTPVPHAVRFLESSAQQVVAVLDQNHVALLDLSSGQPTWLVETAEPVLAPPLLATGALYLGTATGLEKRDPATGELLWHTPTSGSVRARPALLEDRVLVGTEASRVEALDVASGKRRWSLDVGGAVVADLVALGREVLAVTWANQLLCLKRNGHSLWRASVAGRVRQRPVLWRDSVLLQAERTARVHVHGLDGGRARGAFGLDRWDEWLTSPPLVAGLHAIALTSRQRLVAFPLAGGTEVTRGEASPPSSGPKL